MRGNPRDTGLSKRKGRPEPAAQHPLPLRNISPRECSDWISRVRNILLSGAIGAGLLLTAGCTGKASTPEGDRAAPPPAAQAALSEENGPARRPVTLTIPLLGPVTLPDAAGDILREAGFRPPREPGIDPAILFPAAIRGSLHQPPAGGGGEETGQQNYRAELRRDSTALIQLSAQAGILQGRWWSEEDRICQQYPELAGGAPLCGTIATRPENRFRIQGTAGFRMDFQLVQRL